MARSDYHGSDFHTATSDQPAGGYTRAGASSSSSCAVAAVADASGSSSVSVRRRLLLFVVVMLIVHQLHCLPRLSLIAAAASFPSPLPTLL